METLIKGRKFLAWAWVLVGIVSVTVIAVAAKGFGVVDIPEPILLILILATMLGLFGMMIFFAVEDEKMHRGG